MNLFLKILIFGIDFYAGLFVYLSYQLKQGIMAHQISYSVKMIVHTDMDVLVGSATVERFTEPDRANEKVYEIISEENSFPFVKVEGFVYDVEIDIIDDATGEVIETVGNFDGF